MCPYCIFIEMREMFLVGEFQNMHCYVPWGIGNFAPNQEIMSPGFSTEATKYIIIIMQVYRQMHQKRLVESTSDAGDTFQT